MSWKKRLVVLGLEWDWLEKAGFLFPRVLDPPKDPSELWMTRLNFDVDKSTLETY
jgi:hypothetical protein